MLAFGPEELEDKENLGDFILCPKCGKRHVVKHADEILSNGSKVSSKLLSFYKCNGVVYVAGAMGKKYAD